MARAWRWAKANIPRNNVAGRLERFYDVRVLAAETITAKSPSRDSEHFSYLKLGALRVLAVKTRLAVGERSI
jgi:hypothetical protein